MYPVLILVYNRADTYSDLLELVEEADPPLIYVSCDGPANNDDLSEQQEIRRVSERLIGTGKLKFRVQSKNLGLKRAVEAGLDWIFENEEAAIILEDDLLPNQDFFSFCEVGLNRYENVGKIQQVSGYNGLGTLARSAGFRWNFVSPVPQVWGWATWANRWHQYRTEGFDFQRNTEGRDPEETFKQRLPARWREISRGHLESLASNGGSWDYPWAYWGIQRGLGTIIPLVNLVENHGFDDRATHTKEGRRVQSTRLAEFAKFPPGNKIQYFVEQAIWLIEFVWWVRRKLRRLVNPNKASSGGYNSRCQTFH